MAFGILPRDRFSFRRCWYLLYVGRKGFTQNLCGPSHFGREVWMLGWEEICLRFIFLDWKVILRLFVKWDENMLICKYSALYTDHTTKSNVRKGENSSKDLTLTNEIIEDAFFNEPISIERCIENIRNGNSTSNRPSWLDHHKTDVWHNSIT